MIAISNITISFNDTKILISKLVNLSEMGIVKKGWTGNNTKKRYKVDRIPYLEANKNIENRNMQIKQINPVIGKPIKAMEETQTKNHNTNRNALNKIWFFI